MITILSRLNRLLSLPAFLMSAFLLAFTCHLNAITFTDWQAANFTTAELANPAISGPDADPAHDGIRNFLKYAEGLPPKVSSTINQSITQSWESLNYQALSFKQNYAATDLTYVVEVSTDLKTWERGYHSTWLVDGTYLDNNWYRNKYASWDSRLDVPRQFMRLTILKDHNLPADWLMRYFGTSTGIDPEGDEDLDGYTNFEEFVNGYSPLDYYNGQTPILQFLSGKGTQWGLAGSVLTQPISVSINYGSSNAPVTFSVTAGGALLSLDGSTNWNSNIQTRTSTSGDYSALVHIKLPSTVGQISTITATAGTGAKTASVNAYAGVFDPNTPPPTNLTAAATGPDSVELNWTNSDPTKATTIEMSEDDGGSWVVVGVAAPGVTQAFITGLTPDLKVSFRLRTGGTPLAGSGSPAFFGKPTGTQGSPSSGPVSSSGAQKEATPLASPKFLGRQSSYYGYKQGFVGFQNSSHRYLQQVIVTSSTETNNDGDGGMSTDTTTVNAETGAETNTHSGDDGAENYGGEVVIVSDSVQTQHGEDDDGSGETSDNSTTLSNLYTTPVFQANVESWVPAYSGDFGSYNNTASIHLSTDELSYDLTKLQFKWKVNKDPDLIIYWLEIFTPDDGSAPVVEQKNWAAGGATESPLYEINPATKNGKKNGTYKVVPVQALQPPNKANPGSPVWAARVRMSRWFDQLRLQDTDPFDMAKIPDQDADRVTFRVPIPQKAGTSTVTVKVSTENNETGYNKAAVDHELQETSTPGVFESKYPFILVGDEEDDKASYGDPLADDGQKNDRTLIAKPGGKVMLQVPDLSNAVYNFPIARYTRSIEVVGVILNNNSDPLVQAANSIIVDQQIKAMKETYAPYGIKIIPQIHTISVSDYPALISVLNDGKIDVTNNHDYPEHVSEYPNVFSAVTPLNYKTDRNIVVVFSDASLWTVDLPNEDLIRGTNPNRTGYPGWVLVSLTDVNPSYCKFVTAHEIGHSLGLEHEYEGGWSNDWKSPYNRMMFRSVDVAHGSLNKPDKSAKRLLRLDIDTIFKSPFCQPTTE